MTGVSQPSPLAAVRQNAQAMRDAGDARAAQQLLAQTLESARPALGADDPEVLATAHQLAQLHLEADDPTAARRILEEAIAAGQRRLGDADPLMLALSYDLGLVAEELGNRHEARRNFGRIARYGPAVLGEGHWTVRAARDYLGEDGTGTTTLAPTSGQPLPDASTPTHPGPFPPPTVPPQPSRPPTQSAADQWRAPLDAPPYPSAVPSYPPSPQSLPPLVSSPTAPAPRARRRGLIVAVVAAAVLAATAVGVVVLRNDQESPAEPLAIPSPTTTLTGEPPVDVQLRADGSTVTITWTDPADGAVPFVVAGGRAGQDLRKMAEVNAGETRFRITGLSASIDYCFTVSAVYSPDRYRVSEEVCTARAGSASPTST